MLNIDQALAAIETHVPSGRIETVPLGESLGRVLAESVTSSIDSPPFDKALMDGFAVRAADVADGQATLRLIDEVTAGQVASKPIASGEAIQIMTGAPIPEGADAVVRIEDTQIDTSHAQPVVSIQTLHVPEDFLPPPGEEHYQKNLLIHGLDPHR